MCLPNEMECLYSELAAQVVAVERACESASQQLDTTNLQSPNQAEQKRLKHARRRAAAAPKRAAERQQHAAEAEREKAKTDKEEQRVQSIH